MEEPSIIKGGIHVDERGTLSFFNDFDMQHIKRFYIIEHNSEDTRRGWRAHKLEKRWFVVAEGEFVIVTVELTDWKSPDAFAKQQSFSLKYAEGEILAIPPGYAFCLRAVVPNSKILVFADGRIEDAAKDDYLFPLDYFIENI
ncbi:hypothetical protein D3C87_284090 [compost metagenome]